MLHIVEAEEAPEPQSVIRLDASVCPVRPARCGGHGTPCGVEDLAFGGLGVEDVVVELDAHEADFDYGHVELWRLLGIVNKWLKCSVYDALSRILRRYFVPRKMARQRLF